MPLVEPNAFIHLLREGNTEEFNRLAHARRPELENADLRMADLRRAHLSNADLRGAYLRNADLRGLDLSHADLDGASLHDARIAGTLFPPDLDPEEIRLSHDLGTRMRTRRPAPVR